MDLLDFNTCMLCLVVVPKPSHNLEQPRIQASSYLVLFSLFIPLILLVLNSQNAR
jgi:hypothetical protein